MGLKFMPGSPTLPGKIWGWVKGLVIAPVMFSSLLCLNAIQMLSLVVKPFSRKKFRAINRWCAQTYWYWTSRGSEVIHGVRATITGDVLPARENAVVVANHQQMPDIICLMKLAREGECLGDMKWFVKDILKYVPGGGWGMLFLDCLFLKRDWNADRSKIEKTFRKFFVEKIPLWLLSFPEGTRITPSKLAASQAYAKKIGVTPLNHVLFPRTKGFTASVVGLTGHATAVYVVTIAYPDGIPTLWQWTKGDAKRFSMHVKRYEIGKMPKSESELSDWLIARFREMDARLDNFYRTGILDDAGVAPTISPKTEISSAKRGRIEV